MNYYRHATDIVGYTYKSELLHPLCLIEFLVIRGEASPAARDIPLDAIPRGTEEVLDQIAEANAIDRTDEYSFDSGDFPKVVFASMLERNERCGRCNEKL